MFDLLVVAQAQGEAPSALLSFMPMILIFAIFYAVWFLPLRKKQKEQQKLLDELKKGDRVVTTGGILGEIAKVDGANVVLKLSDTVKIRIRRAAIAGLEEQNVEPGR